MKLLSVEAVMSEKKVSELEREERIRKLNAEETASVRRLSEMQEKERLAKERLKEMEKSLSSDESALAINKSVLSSEVKYLEDRKRQALLPIGDLEKDLKEKIAEASETIAKLTLRESELKERSEIIDDRMDAVALLTDTAQEKLLMLEKRESGIASAEAELKRSTLNLSEQWVDFHKSVASANEDHAMKEKNLILRERALADTRESLMHFDTELKEKERGLQDRYATLERSIEEFRNKQK